MTFKQRRGRRRSGDGYGGGRRNKIRTGFGRSASSNTFIPMGIGFIFGIITDMFYNSMGLPGYDTRAAKCEAFSHGDVYQLLGLAGATFIGFLTRNWTVPSFMFGMMSGALIPKVLSSTGFPRYVLFNMDLTKGSISPIGDGGLRGVYKQINPAVDAAKQKVGDALKNQGKPV